MSEITIPKLMRGILMTRTGGSDVLEYRTDLPVPKPADGEVLIKNEYIGINFIDINFRTGTYPVPIPHILGAEAEGTIAAVPSSKEATHGLLPGDRVVWIGAKGAYAEYSICAASKVFRLPSTLPPSFAAASLAQGITAITLIQRSYAVQRGDWILVQNAAGGVGLWLCQLLREVGAKVIGTVSSEAKAELARENGARFLVNYRDEDVVARVLEITGGVGVAAVFDSVGADTFAQGLQLLARNGTMVSYGNSSGDVPPFKITELSAKNLKVMKPSIFGYIATKEEFEKYCGELISFVEKLDVSKLVHKVYPLERAKEAHDDLEGRKTSGKLLLKV